ncbi:MAG: chemotaxis protein CheB [Desulfatirhabdiaceae bacterium]
MNNTAANTDRKTPTHYVGIGASAGGLEAIDAFFTHMPSHSGLAFIVIQHLSPDYKSLMVELLSKKTEMRVHRAEDGMAVEANQVYLIPPKKNLTIFHGRLLLKDQETSRSINLPIDIFLRSLAEDQAERAVAIILSGTGSDGTRGVRAIKEFGGMVMVQDQESAKFDGMPRAAISTGLADFILSPEDMPDQLMSFVEHPYASREKRSETLLTDEDGLTRIFAELREKTKVDFTYYKPSTITRRIERRMTVNRMDDLRDYVHYLQTYPGEVMTLYRELLIGVTSFFRDAEAMSELGETCLPEILHRNRNQEIRFWVSGCSTGEEAYTLAILTKEAMEKEKISRDIKIFATDIDRDAIVSAGNGIYPESIAADLTPRLLTKYFYRKEDNYQIARHIREMVVFAQHNLVRDPPFTNIDLISCRNLLIYLQPILQQKALEMFNFSLNPQGVMFLGSSESIGDMTDCFETVHSKFKIYRSKGKSKSLQKDLSVSLQADRLYPGQRLPVRHDRRRYSEPDDSRMIRRYLELVAAHYIPLSVIVNEQMEIMHIVGNTEGYFSVPSGRVVYDITRMAAKDLAIPLATGIQKVFRTHEEIAYTNIRLRHMDATRNIRMRILPMPAKKGNEALVAVFFEETRQEPPIDLIGDAAYDVGEEARQRIKDLEQELQFARENLQATIEELETSNEELQATNEELLASNEELQSTNEELQSTNEELYTVNAEYQNKIIELTELNNDVDNLLTSSRIGTLLLDENLEIRKYSPEITRIFNIMEKDIGRPVSHLSHRLVDFDPVIMARDVQKHNRLTEQDVFAGDGHWYLTRVMPYHIGPNRFSGVVLTFVDITELKNARSQLQQSDTLFQDITQYMPAGMFVYTRNSAGDLVLESANPKAGQLTGITTEIWKGKRFDDIWPKARAQGITDRFQQVLETGEICYLEDLNYQDDRIQGAYRIQVFQLPGQRLGVIFEDITERKRMEADLQASEAKYRTLFETMAQGVVYQNADGKIISANPSAERILGLSLDQMQGRTSMDPRWKAIRENGEPLSGDEHPSMVALRTGNPVLGFVMGIFSPELDQTRWIMVNATPEFRRGEEKPFQVYTTFEDITDRM